MELEEKRNTPRDGCGWRERLLMVSSRRYEGKSKRVDLHENILVPNPSRQGSKVVIACARTWTKPSNGKSFGSK